MATSLAGGPRSWQVPHGERALPRALDQIRARGGDRRAIAPDPDHRRRGAAHCTRTFRPDVETNAVRTPTGRQCNRVGADAQARRTSCPVGGRPVLRRLRTGGNARGARPGRQRGALVCPPGRRRHHLDDAGGWSLLPPDDPGLPSGWRLVHRGWGEPGPGTWPRGCGRPADRLHHDRCRLNRLGSGVHNVRVSVPALGDRCHRRRRHRRPSDREPAGCAFAGLVDAAGHGFHPVPPPHLGAVQSVPASRSAG